jgi:hypothetical protein
MKLTIIVLGIFGVTIGSDPDWSGPK